MLCIGYGNILRNDDGAGIRAAELIAARHPAIDCITLHELQPELADAVAEHETVIFIDASVRVGEMTSTPLHPVDESGLTASHAHTPQSILNLCWNLYKKRPTLCLLIELPAENLEFGESLSPTTSKAVQDAVVHIGSLLKNPMSF